MTDEMAAIRVRTYRTLGIQCEFRDQGRETASKRCSARGGSLNAALWLRAFAPAFALLFTPLLSAVDASQIRTATEFTQGLVVHVGTSDAQLELEFGKEPLCLTVGLCNDQRALRAGRNRIAKAQLYGRVSLRMVSHYHDLPFVDHLVNLLIADLDALGPDAPREAEIKRVLAPEPRGAAYLKRKGKWIVIRKPRPNAMGDWHHHRKDPNGNMATHDVVGAPTGFQWLAGPAFMVAGRKHSTQALVTASGRNFYLTQNVCENLFRRNAGKKKMPFYLQARDAFNGLPLWKREWKGSVRRGEGQTSFSVVATPKYLFAVEDGKPVALKPESGEILRTYSCSATRQLAFVSKYLIAHTVTGISVFDPQHQKSRWQVGLSTTPRRKSGHWGGTERLLAFGDSRIYVLDNGLKSLRCLMLRDGKTRWTKKLPAKSKGLTFNFANDQVIGLVQRNGLAVYSGDKGEQLWKKGGRYIPRFGNLQQNGHYLTAEGIWVRTGRYNWHVVEPLTGKLIRKFETGVGGKNGCQGAVLGGRQLIASRASTFFDVQSKKKASIRFARGGCGTGFVPANGLHYTIPHACACFPKAVRGFLSLRSDPKIPREIKLSVTKGRKGSVGPSTSKPVWPTFGASAKRNQFCAASTLPKTLNLKWQKTLASTAGVDAQEWNLKVGGPLTQSVCDEKSVYVGLVNACQVVSLDPRSGNLRWRYFTEGRVSTAPTLATGYCLIGDHAGYVHCLDAKTGEMIWRIRATRNGRQLLAYGQLESPWPILGGVLVDQGRAVFASGRADDADGGVVAFGVEVKTGKACWRRRIKGRVGTAGVISKGDKALFVMGDLLNPSTGQPFKKTSLHKAVRPNIVDFQDASWTRMPLALRKGISNRSFTSGKVKAQGQVLSFNDECGVSYQLYKGSRLQALGSKKWDRKDIPFQVESIAMSPDKVLISGVKARHGYLAVLSADDGRTLQQIELPAHPTHQGMSLSREGVYVSCVDGSLLCYGTRELLASSPD